MSNMISALKPLSFPLTGSHLIEASAGTGKTFTIAALYVRLILGHGGDQASIKGKALTPPEILVVTFTDAATKELRDRIRARLSEAADYFRTDPTLVEQKRPGEDLLYDLRADYEPPQWPACARKLQLASEWMDEAAVSTIHGWCNRMLREHAFDSQSLFTQNLETDQSELFSEVIRDYWRNHFYGLAAEDMLQVRGFWTEPGKLEAAVKKLVEHVDLLSAGLAPQQQLQKTRTEKQVILCQLKEPWSVWIEEIRQLFDDGKNRKLVDGKKLQARWYDPWFSSIHTWANTPSQETLDIGTGWYRLSPEGIKEVWKDDNPPKHKAFEAIVSLKQALAELPRPEPGILCHAARWIADAFNAAQKQRAQMGFNDLLTELEAALHSEHGERLATTIRRQFPVALIDEFQDTDPVQYRIFERVYQIAENRDDCALILIGDPKQAIYAFRGADIYTYLKAREAVQDRLYTLDTNYRSTQAMVDAANHSFEFSEARPDGVGAFLFRQNDHNPVPFQPVKANGRKDYFVVEGQTIPALTTAVLTGDETLNKTAYLTQMAEICTTQIVDWLNLGQQQKAGFLDNQGNLTAVKPSDIAILVNNGNEAAYVRQALSRLGVRSVYLSDRDSVYATLQAVEIQRWLSACADPDNDILLRAALSTLTLGLSFAELDELNQDEDVWESRVIQFKGYREIWQRQGVLPLLRNLLFDFGCIERLLQSPTDSRGVSGERVLTDLLHLAELLQQASYTLEGEHALIRFLAEQRAAPANDNDAQKVRLESDADLVKVITIHKSKGLEYPLVFLPFICATRQIKNSDRPLKWYGEDGQLQIGLEASDEVLQLADRDRLGEDIRKVYVALTRARYITWLGLVALQEASISAIGHLLGIGDTPADQLLTKIQAFAGQKDFIAVNSELSANNDQFKPIVESAVVAEARLPKRAAREHWWISSYSGLSAKSHATATVIDDTPQAENMREDLRETLPESQSEQAPQGSTHRFPKGAEAGTFLHELLEWAANQGFQTVLENPSALQETIARRCQARHWDVWAEPLNKWVQALLHTALPITITDPDQPTSIALKDLPVYKSEMEFWFETHHVDPERLDAAVTLHTLKGRPRPKLAAATLNGLLKGFMDLVFEYQGRYYVADYKSNWLGHHDDSYSQANMDEAIRGHRYDLQYSIYLFALHRLLKSRLSDYDYDKHVGGAIYLFMRGIKATSAGVHFERPPKALMEELDRLFNGVKGETA
jgi:exodeoxyribonuclease V beta subunit